MPSGELWFCSYGSPVELAFPESEYTRVQIQLAGAGATSVRGRVIPVTAAQGCISTGAAALAFGSEFQQLAWRISPNALSRKLTAMSGIPTTRRLQFEPALDMTTPHSRTLLSVLNCLVTTVSCTGSAGSLVIAELEQALMVALLSGSQHSLRSQLDRDFDQTVPWQIRRAEEYIRANWDRPLEIEEVAAEVGISARSLFRGFRLSRGYTPMEFARHWRLSHARRMLQDMEAPPSVTEVSLACGFPDVSRFSKDFKRAFGVSPSALLRRRY